METLWIVICWIFLNVVVKLLVSSLERIWRDRIDSAVRTSPRHFKFLFIELIRLTILLLSTPSIVIFFFMLPFWRKSRTPLTLIREYLAFLLSRKRFHKAAPFMAFVLKHPLALIFPSRQSEVVIKWFALHPPTDAATIQLPKPPA